jgi:hypothetical protein
MSDPTLCADHDHAATQCLAKTGHHEDSAVADRLRADLAKQCTPWPGGWCPQTPKEKP